VGEGEGQRVGKGKGYRKGYPYGSMGSKAGRVVGVESGEEDGDEEDWTDIGVERVGMRGVGSGEAMGGDDECEGEMVVLDMGDDNGEFGSGLLWIRLSFCFLVADQSSQRTLACSEFYTDTSRHPSRHLSSLPIPI